MRSNFSDQGAERGLWSAPNIGAPNVAEITKALHAGQVGMADDVARDGYFFPRAWEHPGLLHIYFNALQSAVVRLP